MNFLAHCLIPDRAVMRPHPDLIAGGFLGDFLKGPVPASLGEPLATGVRLHRRIDAYSNRHPGIRASCERFPPALRRYAPIFVDLVADHFLARHWQHFHPQPLEVFTATAYDAIRPHVTKLPERGQRFFHYMQRSDLLADYQREATLYASLDAVLRRLRQAPDATKVAAAIAARLEDLESDFAAYFPDMLAHAADWLADQAPIEVARGR